MKKALEYQVMFIAFNQYNELKFMKQILIVTKIQTLQLYAGTVRPLWELKKKIYIKSINLFQSKSKPKG